MTKAPIDFVWSSLPVPALLINPQDIITEANPAAESFFNISGSVLKIDYHKNEKTSL